MHNTCIFNCFPDISGKYGRQPVQDKLPAVPRDDHRDPPQTPELARLHQPTVRRPRVLDISEYKNTTFLIIFTFVYPNEFCIESGDIQIIKYRIHVIVTKTN